MVTFNELGFAPHKNMPDSVQARVFFPNGYGASVIRGPYTYGGRDGLYELAVLAGDAEAFILCYSTPITDDVVGRQTEDEISALLAAIAALPQRGAE